MSRTHSKYGGPFVIGVLLLIVYAVAVAKRTSSPDATAYNLEAAGTNPTPQAVAAARDVIRRHYLAREETIYTDFGERETKCMGVALPEGAAAPRKLDQPKGGKVWYLPFVTRARFPHLLNTMGLVGYAAEIGSLRGEGAEYLLSGWQGQKLYLVDLWDAVDIWSHEQGKAFHAEMLGRMQHFPGRHEVRKGWSHEVAATFPDNYFDFIFIDAGHSYLDVRRDLVSWWPKLKKGGLFAGHDYYNGNVIPGAGDYVYGVRDAVDEFAEVFQQRVYATNDAIESTGDIQCWYMVKC